MARPSKSKWAERVERLATEFRDLPREGRDAFLRQAGDAVPVKFLLGEQCRRLRRGRLDYARADIQLSMASEFELLRLRSCAKEPWTVRWIERSIGQGDVLYDVGANVGAYSLIAGVASERRARVIAFEPGYANFASLCDNILLNQLEDVVTPLPIALSAKTGLSLFNYRDVRSGAGVHLLEGVLPRVRFDPAYRQPVLSYCLDDLADEFALPTPTHLKLDVDGGELAVLKGAEKTLRKPALRSLMIEVGKYPHALEELLNVHGFTLAEKFEKLNPDGKIMSTWYGMFNR